MTVTTVGGGVGVGVGVGVVVTQRQSFRSTQFEFRHRLLLQTKPDGHWESDVHSESHWYTGVGGGVTVAVTVKLNVQFGSAAWGLTWGTFGATVSSGLEVL